MLYIKRKYAAEESGRMAYQCYVPSDLRENLPGNEFFLQEIPPKLDHSTISQTHRN